MNRKRQNSAAKIAAMPRRPAPTPLEEMAERLRISRVALGYTQATIARLIGSSAPFWNNLEAGTRRISVDKALALKRTTGLTLEWIYDGDASSLPQHVYAKILPMLTGIKDVEENGP